MEISNYVGDSIEYSDFYQYKRGKKGAEKGQNNCYFLDMFNLCNNQKTA